MERRKHEIEIFARKSIRSRVWLQFHIWSLTSIAIISIANIFSFLRPFESSADRTGARQPRLQLAETFEQPIEPGRKPAALSTKILQNQIVSRMMEIQIDCQQEFEVRIPEDVQSLRLRLSDCPDTKRSRVDKAPASTADTNFYVRNETNGFEGTVFRLPTSRDHISTDFITLNKGPNTIRISRSLGDQPLAEQWVTVQRR